MDTLEWLMTGDPAIRWQVMRDLLGEPSSKYERERRKVATEGWGARLLAEQGPDGRWAKRFYAPKWTSTFYTLQLLWQLGLEPSNEAARKGADVILDRGMAGDGGILLAERGYANGGRFGETCETGMALAFGSWFLPQDERLTALRGNLLRYQMPDGGWNCQYRPRGATHASFHTTILALEGLLEWERQRGPDAEVAAARQRGEEFLLAHRMFRSHTTGEVVKKQFTMLSFPGRWHYDVLRGLVYLAEAGAGKDERAGEAVGLVRAKRRKDGTWPLQSRHAGVTFFEMEEAGQPSRWNTLRALTVLQWWDGAPPPDS